jgi:hypothetical protein
MNPNLKQTVLWQNVKKLAMWNWKTLILVLWDIKILWMYVPHAEIQLPAVCKPYIKGIYLGFEVFHVR